jgi:hypothetical protein
VTDFRLLARAAVVVAAVVMGASAVTSGAALARTYSPDCRSIPHYKPSGITIFCADGGMYAHHITWTQWGKTATGRSSRAWANDCKPGCAGGTFHRYTVRLQLFGRRTCRNVTIFTHMRVTFLGPKWGGPRRFTQLLEARPLCTRRYIRARKSGAVLALGHFRPKHDPRYSAAVRVFGEPDTETELDQGNTCKVRWEFLGLTIWFANYGADNACDRRYGLAQFAEISGPFADGWLTSRGLYFGDREPHLRRLYPNAKRHGRTWWLVTGRTPIGCNSASLCPYAVLAAHLRHHKVSAFGVWIGAAGD